MAATASAVRPACSTTSGLPAPRMARAPSTNAAGSRKPSRNAHTAKVRSSAAKYERYWPVVVPASTPLDTSAENPTRGPMFTIASITEPLCETTATRPGDRCSVSEPMYIAERPGAITPMQFGPATASPYSAAISAISRWATVAAGPLSEKPPPGTTAARVPAFAAWRRRSGTRSIRTAATTASGTAGSASSDG